MARKLPTGIRYSKRDNGYIVNLRKYGGGEPKRGTLEEAKALLEHAIAEHQSGGFIPRHTSPTFSAIATKFIEHETDRVRRCDLGNGELANKRTNVDHLIALPFGNSTLGEARVADLRTGPIQLTLVPALFEGRAHKTAANIFTTFGQVLKHAVLLEALKVNPVAGKQISLPTKPETADTLAARLSVDIINVIVEHAGRYGLTIKFAAWTGLRAGEQIALTWEDIDFERGLVHVRRARKKDGSVGAAKTKAGHRSIPIDVDLLAELRAWKLAQPIEQRVNNLVFPTSTGAMDSVDNWRNRGLHIACDRAGVERITWHSLRHFFASILLFDLQEADATVTTLMGHKDISFTRRQYGHWMDDARRDTDIAERLRRARG